MFRITAPASLSRRADASCCCETELVWPGSFQQIFNLSGLKKRTPAVRRTKLPAAGPAALRLLLYLSQPIFPLVARALIIEPFHMPYVRMCVCLRTPHLAYISIASHTCAPYNFASHLSPPRSAAPRSGSARSPRSSSPLSPQQLGKRSFVRLRAHSSHTLSLGRWESLLPHRRVLAVTKCCWRCWGARVTIAALLHTQPFHTHPSVSYRLST